MYILYDIFCKEYKTSSYMYGIVNIDSNSFLFQIMPEKDNVTDNCLTSDIDPIQYRVSEDCAIEEQLINKKKLSEFKPSKETLEYLSRNDVRPLRKVGFRFSVYVPLPLFSALP